MSNSKVEVSSGFTRITKYTASGDQPSIMTFTVECKATSVEERGEVFAAALNDFESALQISGITSMAKNKGKVKTDFDMLLRKSADYVSKRGPINIVLDLIVADTDDGDAFEGVFRLE